MVSHLQGLQLLHLCDSPWRWRYPGGHGTSFRVGGGYATFYLKYMETFRDRYTVRLGLPGPCVVPEPGDDFLTVDLIGKTFP